MTQPVDIESVDNDDAEFDDLLARLLDDAIDDAELQRLAELMASVESRQETYQREMAFAEALAISSDERRLAGQFAEMLDVRLHAESRKYEFLHGVLDRSALRAASNLIRRWAPAAALAVAASVAIAFWAGRWTGRSSDERPVAMVNASGSVGNDITRDAVEPRRSEPMDDSVAVLHQIADAVWKGESSYGVGDSVSPGGMLDLRSGLVQLQFFRGATLTLQGPARLRIDSRDAVMLYEGQAWAKVPVPARGFTVVTPQTKVVDLGTEFGVSAIAGASTEVRVFDGLVEIHDPIATLDTPPRHELVTGQAIRVDADGQTSPLVAQPTPPPAESLLRQKREQRMRQGYQKLARMEWSGSVGSASGFVLPV